MTDEIELVVSTGKGIPCLWEEGGAHSAKHRSGAAVVIAGKQLERLRAIYVTRKNDRPLGQHALIPVQFGDHVIRAEIHCQDDKALITVEVSKVGKINVAQARAVLLPVSKDVYSIAREGTFHHETEAIRYAVEKAQDYECTEPYFCLSKDEAGAWGAVRPQRIWMMEEF